MTVAWQLAPVLYSAQEVSHVVDHTAVLVVEVSDTSLALDRRKARLYAMSGVADYWILNLIDRVLEGHREPLPGGGPENGPAYASMRVYQPDDAVAPLAAVKVAELLP